MLYSSSLLSGACRKSPTAEHFLASCTGHEAIFAFARGEKGQEAKMAAVILQLCLSLYKWQVYSFFLFSCAAKATDNFYDCANFLSVQGVIKFFLIYSLSQEGFGSGWGGFKHIEKLFTQYIAQFIRGFRMLYSGSDSNTAQIKLAKPNTAKCGWL